MAAQVTQEAGPVELLEESARLLRHAPLRTWLCHWAGCLPFILAALRFWNDVTNPRMPDVNCALEALLLALLLVWMNSWRAVFAGRLRAQLSGAGTPRLPAARWYNLVAGQAFLGATKLVVLPFSMLILFPFAAAVAFYRTAAALAGYEDLHLRDLIQKARRLAVLDQGQGWGVLPILTFLYVIIALNTAIVLALLPQLVRMLTGYETSFTRSGLYYVASPLFILLVLAVAWLAIDPLAQAVYSVRAFHGESMTTGEDLRVALRRIAVVFLLVAVIRPAPAVTPAELEKGVSQAVESSDYDWRLPPPPGTAQKPSWLVSFTDRVIGGVESLYQTVANWIAHLLKWLFPGRGAPQRPGEAPSSALHWSIYALMVLVALAIAWILWRRRGVRIGGVLTPDVGAAVRLDADDLTADRLPEEKWNELAEQALREGNPRLALRALYLASLAWLGRREFLSIDSGKTNREYEAELRRRTRAFPEARSLFAANISAFERTWYGMHDVAVEDLGEFRRRTTGMKTILEAGA
jgi:hypothetical protein